MNGKKHPSPTDLSGPNSAQTGRFTQHLVAAITDNGRSSHPTGGARHPPYLGEVRRVTPGYRSYPEKIPAHWPFRRLRQPRSLEHRSEHQFSSQAATRTGLYIRHNSGSGTMTPNPDAASIPRMIIKPSNHHAWQMTPSRATTLPVTRSG